jgi:hypothetical protein
MLERRHFVCCLDGRQFPIPHACRKWLDVVKSNPICLLMRSFDHFGRMLALFLFFVYLPWVSLSVGFWIPSVAWHSSSLLILISPATLILQI